MKTSYFHSVTLDKEHCKGCTNCIKKCPTEAIRVREGKAHILEERCIDCGECIRICPNHAKVAVTDGLERLAEFKYRIALPAPSFYGQFNREVMPARVLAALLVIGFDHVYEVALSAEAVTLAIQEHLRRGKHKRPLISSACPAVVRLMQVRFPGLLPHVIPVKTPMEIAARMAKEEACRQTGLPGAEVGTFFISPCPAKVTAVKQPLWGDGAWVDGVLSMSVIYGEVRKHLRQVAERPDLHRSSGNGIGWGRAGGENVAIGGGSLLAVDGIHSVISVLEEVEKGGLGQIDYLEAQACVGGCIGGPLVVQNPFVARVQVRQLAEKFQPKERGESKGEILHLASQDYFRPKEPLAPRPVMQLDEDTGKALSKMAMLERTVSELPGLDCGSCGSPNCRALAEDIVRGMALETDCIFKLRERVRSLAEEMVELAQKVPPAMGKMAAGREEVKQAVTVGEMVESLQAVVLVGQDLLGQRVTGAYCSDLLSDTMASAKEGNTWFTIQTHPNIVAVASLLNLSAVVVTGGKEPDPETLTKAEQERVVILCTKLPTFEAAGRLYSSLGRIK